MTRTFKKALLLIGMTIASSSAIASSTECTNKEYTLQLLGSGGPISDDQRASSGELIWWKGKPKILIDAGGGVYLRFGQAGAQLEDVDMIGMTHFHTDHSVDLPALLKGSYFFQHSRTTDIIGPTGNSVFPSLTNYMKALFNPQTGAYAYLAGIYDGTDGIKMKVNLMDVDYHLTTPTKVFEKDGLTVTALGIPHGDVPTIAYRIDSPEGRIVISADQNGSNEAFIDFAKDADILVMPAAIDENADSTSQYMHAKPSIIGKIAQATHPKMLVLNHFMGKSLFEKDKTIETIKKFYTGPIYAGRDESCFSVAKKDIGEKP